MKVAIVGDVHLTERNPRIRKDNYFETTLNKLDFIASNNDYVIILGDLFHTYNNPDYVFYKTYDLMKKHNDKFITIAGNHDFFHRNYNSLPRTTIGCLVNAGVLNLQMSSFYIDNLHFNVVLVDTPVDEIEIDKDNSRILLGHKYFEMPTCPSESLTRKDINELNYRLVFLGHDHKPYEEEYIGSSTLIRMGSLTRMDAQLYNRDRQIVYYQLDSETGDYVIKRVPIQGISECCIDGAFDKVTGVKENTISFLDIEKAINKMCKKADGNISLNKTLHNLGAKEDQINLIKEMYQIADVDYN